MIEDKYGLNEFIDSFFKDRREVEHMTKNLTDVKNGDIYNSNGKNPLLLVIIRVDIPSSYRENVEKLENISKETDSPMMFFKIGKTSKIPFRLFEYIENWMGYYERFSKIKRGDMNMNDYYYHSVQRTENFPTVTILSTENVGKIVTNISDCGVLTPKSMRNREKLCVGGAEDWAKRLSGGTENVSMKHGEYYQLKGV